MLITLAPCNDPGLPSMAKGVMRGGEAGRFEDWPAASCLRNTVTATPMGSARSSCDLGVDSS